MSIQEGCHGQGKTGGNKNVVLRPLWPNLLIASIASGTQLEIFVETSSPRYRICHMFQLILILSLTVDCPKIKQNLLFFGPKPLTKTCNKSYSSFDKCDHNIHLLS